MHAEDVLQNWPKTELDVFHKVVDLLIECILEALAPWGTRKSTYGGNTNVLLTEEI